MRENDYESFEELLKVIESINPNWQLDRVLWKKVFFKRPISHIAAGVERLTQTYEKKSIPFPADLIKVINEVIDPIPKYKGSSEIIRPRDDLWGDMFFAAMEFFVEIQGYQSFWNNYYDLLDSWEFYSVSEPMRNSIISRGQMTDLFPAEKREWNWFKIREDILNTPGSQSKSNLWDYTPRRRKQYYWAYACKWIKAKLPVDKVELTASGARVKDDSIKHEPTRKWS